MADKGFGIVFMFVCVAFSLVGFATGHYASRQSQPVKLAKKNKCSCCPCCGCGCNEGKPCCCEKK